MSFADTVGISRKAEKRCDETSDECSCNVTNTMCLGRCGPPPDAATLSHGRLDSIARDGRRECRERSCLHSTLVRGNSVCAQCRTAGGRALPPMPDDALVALRHNCRIGKGAQATPKMSLHHPRHSDNRMSSPEVRLPMCPRARATFATLLFDFGRIQRR